jgi:predicted PurR-regulated permease PerM
MSEQLNALTPEPPPTPAPQVVVQPPPVEEKGFNFWGLFAEDEPAPAPAPIPEPTAPVEKSSAEVVSDKIVESSMEAGLSLLLATPVVIAQVMTSLILFLFLLTLGPNLFEVALEASARVKDKRRAIVLVANLRRHLSRYIVTVSIINGGMGAATGLILWWLGVEDALLWGVLVAVLNFAPYIGPLLSVGVLSLAGLAQYGAEIDAVLPALVYLVLNLLESQLVTPLVLGRNMRLNPLAVVFWLIIWGWLWGATGVLLAVPLLVCIKLIAESLHIAPGWIRVLEG